MIVRSASQSAAGAVSTPPSAEHARVTAGGAPGQPEVCTANSWRGPLLDGVLRGIRPQSVVAFWPEFRPPWGVSFERDWAVFHIVVQGACWLQLKGFREPVQLSEGDFAVVKGGQYHTVRDSPS